MLVFDPHHGLTHVLDKGLGPRAWEDVLEVAGDHVAIVKLGWGTAAVTQNLERKLEVLREKPVVIGGTYFEVIYAKDRLDDYKRWLNDLGLTHVEISDGTVSIPRERKLELIADFARDFTVLSEVGSKDPSVEYTAEQWVEWLREELDAGAWKVITEAREGGTAGIFDSEGGMSWLLLGSIPGVWISSRYTLHLPQDALRLGLAGVLALSGIKLLNLPGSSYIIAGGVGLGLAAFAVWVLLQSRSREAERADDSRAAAARSDGDGLRGDAAPEARAEPDLADARR